jgi:exodeoxyribonuclease VII large subunit
MNGIYSVEQLNKYVNGLLTNDSELGSLTVRGEISGYKKYPSGHAYFQLKDLHAQVSCVLFRGNSVNLSYLPEDGMRVIVSARASLYEQDGRFQLIIYDMTRDGIGDLYLQFEKVKQKLQEEGLFDFENKKKLPFIPNRIGVITSSKGAVINDIINVLSRRFPGFRLLLYPSSVQGHNAHAELASGIQWFNRCRCVDVIIIARGGGSIEDLWSFNEESLSREIFASEIPVISAVGHETDYTLADLVADFRAPTPSAAAEIVMPDKGELLLQLQGLEISLRLSLSHYISNQKNQLRALSSHRALHSPKVIVESESQRLDHAIYKMRTIIHSQMSAMKMQYHSMAEKFLALSPLNVMARGYAIVSSNETGIRIESIKDVFPKQNIVIRMADGNIQAQVLTTEPGR